MKGFKPIEFDWFKSNRKILNSARNYTLPVAIVYLLLQKYIISGMTAGAVKG